MRAGFTLIEALIALVLFQIGMLALAATSAVAARDLGVANRRTRAHAVAAHRVARLRTGSCPSPASGTAKLGGGLTEHWRVDAAGKARIVSDSIVLVMPGGRTSSVVARVWTLCGR